MLIDSHCHLPPDQKKTEQILNDAKTDDVKYIVNIGTDLSENEKVMESVKNFKQVYGSIGIYPHSHRDKEVDSIINKLEGQINSKTEKIIAIGECGIDITEWGNQRPVEQQKKLFEEQIKLGIKYNLPIIIHNRNGDEHVQKILKKYEGKIKGVAHCFDGEWESAKAFLDLGFFISFSGFITFNSKKYLTQTVERVPSDKFVIETDSPYIVPKGVNSKSNEPKNVKIIAKKVAEIKQIPFEEVCELTWENTSNLFSVQFDKLEE